VGKRFTASPEAFESYLRAQYLFKCSDLASKREAMNLFRQAAAQDPSYALPWIDLARIEMFWAMAGLEAPLGPVQRARSALLRALEREPDLAEAHALLALIEARHC
jgi:adenylate cyclase